MINKINSFFLKQNNFSFIICFVLLSIFLSLLHIVVLFFLNVPPRTSVKENSLIIYFFTAVLFAPIVETLFFQCLPIEFLKLYKIKDFYIILILGVLFGFAHYFNSYQIRDVVITSFLGFLYAYAYILIKKRRNLNPIFGVSLIHFGYNLFVFSIKTLS